MADEVLPVVCKTIELAEALADVHDAPVFRLPATLGAPSDVIATLVNAVWRAKQAQPPGPVPTCLQPQLRVWHQAGS